MTAQKIQPTECELCGAFCDCSTPTPLETIAEFVCAAFFFLLAFVLAFVLACFLAGFFYQWGGG